MSKVLFVAILVMMFVMIGCSSYAPMFVNENSFSKVGETSMTKGGVIQAAQNGGISKVAIVDFKQTSLFGFLILSRTYIVAGE